MEIFKLASRSDENILIELIQEFYLIEEIVFDEKISRAALQELLNNQTLGLIHLIEIDGQIAGYFVITFFFSLEFGGRCIILDELYLRSSYRGKGLAKKSLEFLEEFCRREQIKLIGLEVNQKNTRAQDIYYKAGFRDNGRYFLAKLVARKV